MPVVGWAQMGTRSSGTGDLELIELAGLARYTGSSAVKYAIQTPLGAYEEGTAQFNGHTLTGRAPTDSSSSGGAAISVPVPPKGVVVYLAEEVSATTLNEGVLVDGDYGEVIVSGTGATITLKGTRLTLAELQAELGIAATSQKTCELVRDLSGVANGTFAMDISATFPYTVQSITHEGSEPLTAAFKIGSTDITGLAAVAVTTSVASTSATAANAVSVGQRVNVVLTDIATTGDARFKMVVIRG